jgi:hypothetical protein
MLAVRQSAFATSPMLRLTLDPPLNFAIHITGFVYRFNLAGSCPGRNNRKRPEAKEKGEQTSDDS